MRRTAKIDFHEKKLEVKFYPEEINKLDDLYGLRELYVDMVYDIIPRVMPLNVVIKCVSRIDELLDEVNMKTSFSNKVKKG